MKDIKLSQADRAEITVVIDNYIDVLLADSTEVVKRASLIADNRLIEAPLAEHGLSLLVRIFQGTRCHTMLLDAGWSNVGVPRNLKLFGINLGDIESIVLSHGHMDHFGALAQVLTDIGKKTPLVVHPDVFITPRYNVFPDGRRVEFPFLDEQSLIKAGAEIIKTKSPLLLASDMAATLGEVERVTDFEKGMPNVFLERGGKVEPDPILDDQGIIINIKDKGLLLVSGCAHSGIINTIRHAQKITGVDKVYAILGGFHLAGPFFEPIINRTVEELKKIAPSIVAPMHCTGWRALNQIATEMPQQFVLSSVGTRFIL